MSISHGGRAVQQMTLPVSVSFLVLLPSMGLDNPCCVDTPLNLQPKDQYFLDGLIFSVRCLSNTKEEEEEAGTSVTSAAAPFGSEGEKTQDSQSHSLGSSPGSGVGSFRALGHSLPHGFERSYRSPLPSACLGQMWRCYALEASGHVPGYLTDTTYLLCAL